MSAALQMVVVEELVVCDAAGCRTVYVLEDGWDGWCPSCVLVRDEHAGGLHAEGVPNCLLCW